jgi:Delta7-sterol 5-desaturase
MVGGFFEFGLRASSERSPQRRENMKKELWLGLWALVFNVAYATLWLWKVDAHTPFFGYFATHEYTFGWFVVNVAVYLLFMDTFFYWSHRLLHMTKPINLWYHIHRFHHQFVDPTPFAQDAVHPIEAILQGPLPHYLSHLVCPMHPVVTSILGFLTGVYAIAAHDGRKWDFNDHIKHHHYKQVNFGLYWGLWDYICGTRWTPEKHSVRTYDEFSLNPAPKGTAPVEARKSQ